MARIVSTNEAQNDFEGIVQWAEENHSEVVVEFRGKPAAAIVTYEEYQALLQLREEQRRRKIFAELEELRREVSSNNTDLTPEEVYRLAGFSEEVIRETLEYDAKIARGEV